MCVFGGVQIHENPIHQLLVLVNGRVTPFSDTVRIPPLNDGQHSPQHFIAVARVPHIRHIDIIQLPVIHWEQGCGLMQLSAVF